MQLKTVKIEKPDDTNFILGQTHFIKSVEAIHEALVPEQGGPIGVMLHEHGLGRGCVGRMREASQAQPLDARTFADAARQYIPLLRQHIFKENNVLFRMAEQVIPNDLDENTKLEIQTALSSVIHHGTRPLTLAEWQGLLESEGFSVQTEAQAPMHLLEPWRIIKDEGMFGALRFAVNLLCNREARHRVLAMRRVFSKYRDHLAAVMMVGQKQGEVLQ